MSQPYQDPQAQQGYAQAPPAQMGHPTPNPEGDKAAQLSLIFGIIGLFVLGIVFGPLAISQANKAEKLNTPATAGKVLGWISLVVGILWVIGIILWILFVVALVGSASTF